MDLSIDTIISLAILFIILAFLVFLVFNFFSSISRDNNLDEVYYQLSVGLRQNTIDEDDVLRIYNHIYKKRNAHTSYVDFLEIMSLYIRKKDSDGELTSKFKALTNSIIVKEKTEKPYFNVDDKERRALLAIEIGVANNEKTSVKKNLEDLAVMIEDKQKALGRQKKVNTASMLLTLVSILLSVFMWIHGSSLSEKDIKNLSKQMANEMITQMPKQTSPNLLHKADSASTDNPSINNPKGE